MPMSKMSSLFHPSIFCKCSQSKLTLSEGPGCMFITGLRHIQPFTHSPMSHQLTYQPSCHWTVGGKQSTQREPTQTRGGCEATLLTTAPPCRPLVPSFIISYIIQCCWAFHSKHFDILSLEKHGCKKITGQHVSPCSLLSLSVSGFTNLTKHFLF